MTKAEQHEINNHCMAVWDDAMSELWREKSAVFCSDLDGKPLRSCQASVFETSNYYIIKSYKTRIAAIDKESGLMVDMLRYEYEFTRTSAMHLAKFAQDYRAKNRLTYRAID